MTLSKKNDIIGRVNWIHTNREKIKELHLEKGKIEKTIQELSAENVDKINKLKIDMSDTTEMRIKIDGKYYSLVQYKDGVEITEFFIDIDAV